ncbi:MAG: hypothetical protein ACT4RN_14930 [Pseudonocardia sp.]
MARRTRRGSDAERGHRPGQQVARVLQSRGQHAGRHRPCDAARDTVPRPQHHLLHGIVDAWFGPPGPLDREEPAIRTDQASPTEPALTDRVARPALSMPVTLVLAASAGGLWALGAQPRGWWPLLPLGVAVLTVALHGQHLRARLLIGALAGAVLYGSTLAWLTGFAVAGYVGIAVLEALLLAVAVGSVPTALSGRWSGGWWSMPAWLVLLDAAQTRFPFDGFPLPALVHSQLDGPFALAAPLGGSLLVTATAAAAGVGLAIFIAIDRSRRHIRADEIDLLRG